MKKHKFYMKISIFPLTFVIIVFAFQLCFKPLHYHTMAHYSSSHISHIQSEKQESSLPSAFSLVCLLISQFLLHSSLPSSFTFFWSSAVTMQAHNGEYLDTRPSGCPLIPPGNLCNVSALASGCSAASRMREEILLLNTKKEE